MSFVELTGHAKLDRRTKNLVKRLSADDIAIIDHTDLDRVSAEAAARVRRPRRRQRRRVAVRTLPEPGAARARARRHPPDRRRRRRHLRRRARGRAADRARRERSTATARASLRAVCSRSASSSSALAEQRGRVTEALEAFAENTMRYLREEGKLLAEGIDFPAIATRFRDRHALVVARGPGHKRDLRMVRPYIRDFKPVLIAVDGGADALLEAGYKPDVIVGDMDSRVGRSPALRCRAARPRLPRRRMRPVRSGRSSSGCRTRSYGDGDQRGHRAAAGLREGRRADRRGRARTST